MTITEAIREPPPKRSTELANAVYDDWKRKAIDTAKKRAAAQFADYESFKNMVLTAHLKPLGEKIDHDGIEVMPAWQVGRDGLPLPKAESAAARALRTELPSTAPSTAEAFERDWRRCCPSPDQKYHYLRTLAPNTLRRIFQVEVKSTVLSQIVSTLAECWLASAGILQDEGKTPTEREACTPTTAEATAAGGALRGSCDGSLQGAGDEQVGEVSNGSAGGASERAQGSEGALKEAGAVLGMLRALAASGRFALTLRLLPSGVKAAVRTLLTDLQEAAVCSHGAAAVEGLTEAGVREVAASYGVLLQQAGGQIGL